MSIWSEPVLTCFSAREKAVPQALLFDLDGTLIDSVPDLAAAIDQMLVQLGQAPAGETLVAEWVGNGVDMLVRRALCQGNDLQALALDDADVAAAQALFDPFYLAHLNDATGVYPGVTKTLTTLAVLGIRMALVTNKPRAFTEVILDSLGWQPYFDAVVCGDDLPQRKPDPAQLLYACELMAVEPQQTMMVGDSRNDMYAGKAAGCVTVAVPYGYNHGENIATCQPNLLIHSLAELIEPA